METVAISLWELVVSEVLPANVDLQNHEENRTPVVRKF